MRSSVCLLGGFLLIWVTSAHAQQAGSIRGVVYDRDFDSPVAAVRVTVAETGQAVTATDQGNYVITGIKPGNYTLIFAKEGYTREVKPNVIVQAGQLTDADVTVAGDVTEMEEFVVQEVKIGGSSEAGLLALRFDSPAFMDSIGADLMSRAGASDAASALNLVSGATVQDGKYAVIRGLPDRFVNTQINGVRLPTADPNKRAVELDQFPSTVIESIQVTKTFTPDQQGDASGGVVNLVLKSIPDEPIFQIGVQTSINTQTTGRSDFLTYDGGGIGVLGKRGDLSIPSNGRFDRTVGPSTDDAPIDYDLDMTLGGSHEFDNGVRIGGIISGFYKRDSSYYNDGIDDDYWILRDTRKVRPQAEQGSESEGDFKTSLFDVTRGVDEVKWGGLASVGLETEHHRIDLTYLYTRVAEDAATLAQNTRGKKFFFPDYDPNDPSHPGNVPGVGREISPYTRLETLKYVERTTQTFQMKGKHTLPISPTALGEDFTILPPELDWTFALSSARLYEPDKRQLSSLWTSDRLNNGTIVPARFEEFKPAANFTLGNLQRTWKTIDEDSEQYQINVKFPFEQWTGDKGYLKLGFFLDETDRTYDQESFSNLRTVGDPRVRVEDYVAPFSASYSAVFPTLAGPSTKAGPPFADVDYTGDQRIMAWYWMVDLPLNSWFKMIGGLRFESTELGIQIDPEADATWYPPGAFAPRSFALDPDGANVDFHQDDVLPSIGVVFNPTESITLRASYSETVARQTFKELTPVQQQEFLGGDVFIGNPFLQMAALRNYDIRVDYTPYPGALLSASWFYKDISNAIENVQERTTFTFTRPQNYPKGELMGVELEVRQDLGHLWENLQGLSIGGNATIINSQVTLPEAEAQRLASFGFPMPERDMTNAPEYLYNIYLTYELERTGTQFALFYTVRGDTLVAGASEDKGNFVPNVYEAEYGTLNFSITQKLGQHFKLQFKAKNLTDPAIREIYRSDYNDDLTKSSHHNGIDLSFGISAEFKF